MELCLSEFDSLLHKQMREWVLQTAKVGVSRLGQKLSHLLVDFLFIMSRDEEQHLYMYQYLRAELESVIVADKEEGGPLLVVDKIFALIKTGEKRATEVKKMMKLKPKRPDVELSNAVCEMTEIDERDIKKPKWRPVELTAAVCKMIERFCGQIVVLEYIVSEVSTRNVTSQELTDELNGCEKELDNMAEEIHDSLNKDMNNKVRQLWKAFELK